MAENTLESVEESKFSITDLVSSEIVSKWDNIQNELKKKLIIHDTEDWQNELGRMSDKSLTELKNSKSKLRYLAGLDISFSKVQKDIACAGIVVIDLFDNLKVVYEDLSIVTMTEPYVPGYLSFREAQFHLDKLQKLKETQPSFYPQCLLIDGNGIFHPKKFGLASHVGVLSDTPSIGVAKTLFQVDGIEDNDEHKRDKKEKLKKNGDFFELKSNKDNEVLALCYRNMATNPVYLSIGHKCSWNTCLDVVSLCSPKYRIPEPVRQADIRTREYLRVNFDHC